MKIFFFEINNRTVTSFYLNIIIEALKNCGYEVLPLKDTSATSLKKISTQRHDTWFITTGHKDITQLYFKGYRNFIHWFQGLPAEEDFMRTHNKLRLWGLNFLDKMTIKHCSYAFFVSSYQKDYITLSCLALTRPSIPMFFSPQGNMKKTLFAMWALQWMCGKTLKTSLRFIST